MAGIEESLMSTPPPEVEAAFDRIHAVVEVFEGLDRLDPSERKAVLDDFMARFNDGSSLNDVALTLGYLAGEEAA